MRKAAGLALLFLELWLVLVVSPLSQHGKPFRPSRHSGSQPSELNSVKSEASVKASPMASGFREATDQAPTTESMSTQARVSETYGNLPLSFEPNRGQVDPAIKYLARGKGYSLFLKGSEAVFQLAIPPDYKPANKKEFDNLRQKKGRTSLSILQMKFLGANRSATLEGLVDLPGKTNYIIGNDPTKWVTDLPTYSKLKVKSLYPGIDLVFHGDQGQLEYDFVVNPGSDPDLIQIAFEGMRGMSIDQNGGLILNMPGGEIRQDKPKLYEEIDGTRKEVPGSYVLTDDKRVAFRVTRYHKDRGLVIDPVLVYSTYLGGSSATTAFDIAVDSSGNAYVTGATDSSGFPTTPGAFQPSYNTAAFLNTPDAFVCKINPGGTALIYSTYLGGNGQDQGNSIAVDNLGNAYVTGGTNSIDFPTTLGAFKRETNVGGVFVTKINPSGSALIYSTLLGRGGSLGIAIDSSGNAFVVGNTTAQDFPTANAFQPTKSGNEFLRNAFVTKLNIDGSALVYSTYLSGPFSSEAKGVAVDGGGNAFVTGLASRGFPTTIGAYRTTCDGGFVTKFKPAGNALVYSTCLEGSPSSIAIDGAGSAYVTGSFVSLDEFPISAGAFHTQCSSSAILIKLNSSGSALEYSTCFASVSAILTGPTAGYDIALDGSGNVYVTGQTQALDFPTLSPVQLLKGGRSIDADAFVTKFNVAGSALVYSTFLGGADPDAGFAIAVGPDGSAYVAGGTMSADFHTARPLQPDLAGNQDAFVARIEEDHSASFFVPIVLSSGGARNSFYTSELSLTNSGSTDAILHFTYTAAFGGGDGVASDRIAAGRQRIVSDAISYLRSVGIPIPEGAGRGGTLMIRFSGLSEETAAGVTVRTTTAVPGGRAGLAYSGVPRWALWTKPSYLFGLRQNATDRSNVAIQNAGTEAEGEIVIRLTLFSGDPSVPFSQVLPDVRLVPGGFKQFNEILASSSLSNGYVRVERVSGKAPYYAYAVINDQSNSDGSFITPVLEREPSREDSGVVLPVLVEAGSFTTELVLQNPTPLARTVPFTFVATSVQSPDATTSFSVDVQAGEQVIIPNFVEWLRERQVPGIGPIGPAYVGALFKTTASDGYVNDFPILLGARVSAPGGGGRFGLFYQSVPYYRFPADHAWLYSLQQNAETRTNLGLINSGESGDITVSIELFDGETGTRVNTVDGIVIKAREWRQIDLILDRYAPGVLQGYARVVRTEGASPFIVYSVINDGGQPGTRTGDGAFIASAP